MSNRITTVPEEMCNHEGDCRCDLWALENEAAHEEECDDHDDCDNS